MEISGNAASSSSNSHGLAKNILCNQTISRVAYTLVSDNWIPYAIAIFIQRISNKYALDPLSASLGLREFLRVTVPASSPHVHK